MTKPSEESYFYPIEMVTRYYEIAYQAFLRADSSVTGRREYEKEVSKRGGKWTEEDLEFLQVKQLTHQAEERASIVAVIFSALSLEALINNYAVFAFSKRFLDNHLDRLEPYNKWLIVPRLVKRETIKTGGQTFQKLKELFSLRNKLVHFKSSQAAPEDSGPKKLISRKDAKHAIETVRKAVRELERLDRRAESRWLEVTEKAINE